MSARLKRNLDFLRILAKAPASQRKAIIKSSSSDLVTCLCEIVDNILSGTVSLAKQRRAKLKQYTKILRTLANRKVPISKKKRLLVQKGGGAFLPALLVPILAIAGSLLANGSR